MTNKELRDVDEGGNQMHFFFRDAAEPNQISSSRERLERQLLKEAKDRKARKQQAAVTAQKIIDEIGIEIIAQVLEADCRVADAMREAVKR